MSLPAAKVRPLLTLLFVAGAATALSACSMAPFQVEGSDEAVASAQAQAGDKLERLRPRAYGVCYSPSFNELVEVEAEAVYLCEGGRLERVGEEDFFWNGCSLTQPNRINYICHPADKAEQLRSSGS